MSNRREKIGRRFAKEREPGLKFVRDPIHDLIKIDDRIILDLIDTAPMQRLRRIKQLGAASLVYPGADHSRFVHSLGVYHMSRRLLNQLGAVGTEYEYDRMVVMIAALLHDVGHGPFSHLFESVLKECGCKEDQYDHEEWTKRIIQTHPEITGILDSYDPKLKNDVIGVIAKSYRSGRQWLSGIVTSQFDADRLDYMLRDSHMTGVKYGAIDISWLLRSLTIGEVDIPDEDGNVERSDERIVVDVRRGLSSIEEYLLGNLYLYEHVYYHKTVIAAETMIQAMLRRAKDMFNGQKPFDCDFPVLRAAAEGKNIGLDDYCTLDDTDILSHIKEWADGSVDETLTDLSRKYLARDLFKIVPIPVSKSMGQHLSKLRKDVRQTLERAGLETDYYFAQPKQTRVAYKTAFTESPAERFKEIWCRGEDMNVLTFSELVENGDRRVGQAIEHLKLSKQYFVLPSSHKQIVDDIVNGARQ